jgi:hypothetical protein
VLALDAFIFGCYLNMSNNIKLLEVKLLARKMWNINAYRFVVHIKLLS